MINNLPNALNLLEQLLANDTRMREEQIWLTYSRLYGNTNIRRKDEI